MASRTGQWFRQFLSTVHFAIEEEATVWLRERSLAVLEVKEISWVHRPKKKPRGILYSLVWCDQGRALHRAIRL